ncbi:hypothetical protein BGW42_007855 [Actinomortierella wolfii]|nr:hypothetical protein BGW42_007855 [Actinomortierella wolfii]
MAVLCALPQLRIFHLSATDPSSWPHCLVEMAEKTDFYDSEDRTQPQCYSRLERLQVSNFQFYVEDLIKVLERCPQLEDLQLVGSLSGSWGVSGKSVFIAHCARLRSLHITPSTKMSTITPIYRDFQDVVSELPKLTRLGTVYQAACTDTKTHNRITHQDTLATVQQTMSNLTWLYLAEPSWTKPTTCESILPFLHDMPHLEYFYAPFSFVDLDQLAITKKHRRHVEPWVSPRLKVLDLGFTNTLYGNASWMHGEHHPTLRTRDIFEFIGRSMPNLVHLRLRLFSGVTLYPDGGMHYLGWLDKLETLVVVARTTVAHYDEWKVGMFEWLGKPPTPAPEPGSIFYTGARKPKSKVTTKVKSWLLHSTNDMDVEKKEEDATWDYGFFDDLALPNLKRFHIQLFENSLGGVASNAVDYVLRELEKCIREVRKDDKLNVTVEEKRWEKSNMIFHRPEGNVIVSRDSFDE